MDITFDCPKCGQELAVDDSYIGETIECPECSAQIVVPGPAESEPIFENTSDEAKDTGSSAEEKKTETPAPGAIINAMASSAAARERKSYSVPVHKAGEVPKDALIQKPQTPLSVASKKWANGVAVKTIRRVDCMEVGKDHFDEKVTEFINTVGHDRIISVQSIAYTTQDLATKALMTDFGVLIMYRIPEK